MSIVIQEHPEYGYIEASSLSRLLRMLGEPRHEPADPSKPADPKANPNQIKVGATRPFAILTAWRDIYDVQKNRKLNAGLLAKLNAEKMGPYKLVGYFQNPPEGMTYDEARESGKLGEAAKEDSFLVPMPNTMSFEEFDEKIANLAFSHYGQWAYIIGDGEAVYEVVSGRVAKSGRFKRRKIGTGITMPLIQQAYSLMRGHEDKPFVFAGVVTPTDMGMMRHFKFIGLSWVTPNRKTPSPETLLDQTADRLEKKR